MQRLLHFPLALIALLVALPVLAVLAALLQWNAASSDILAQMASTVLPQYAITSIALCAAVAGGTALIGMSTACAVTLFEFKGRRFFEWALLLPLAMPAYVSAYAYTDFLQFSGPAQTWIRETFGLQGRVLPEIRSTWGAALLFIFTLYPYVYLLSRAALSERAAHLMEAARLLGAPLGTRIRRVALPLARPAVAAGVSLALMETLADYGVSSYFGIQTFTAGIYKAWLAMDDRISAAQLAVMLLIVVAVLLKLERRAQKKMRFSAIKGQRAGSAEAKPVQLTNGRQIQAQLLCALPILLGFALPVLMMLRLLLAGAADDEPIRWAQFAQWAFNSFKLAGIAALLATALALMLAFAQRRQANRFTHGITHIVGMGYAVPGAVIVVGLLIPVGLLQTWQPNWSIGALVTTTILGVIWAYLVRFTAVALQSIQSGYSRIPQSLDDSARMLGSSSINLLTRVHAPLLSRSAAVAALLVFVDVMKELPATLVLRPFNHDTLAVVAYQLAKDERLAEAALPSLALVLVGLIPVIFLSRSLRTPR
ncbi:iron ABC transporter permease [Variovorax sp. PCZ-1]|uniref:ABC transporter permease n=1 Tax=Variovorax sp. PCZ-1 TaxID=2835533 RepID=UPI001BCF5970|nr:iron ABC transporter permease [Variovorax sp. PCZ-1]